MSNDVNPEHAKRAAADGAASPIWARAERPRHERPALGRDQIIRVALELADAAGIDAISLRRIAARLKVSAMALYWYVDRKDDVLDLMIDAVYGEVPLPPPGAADWQSQLHEFAVQTRAMMHRHPWFAALLGQRAVLGPNALKKTDYLLGILRQQGFDITTSSSIVALLNAYITGFVVGEIGEAEAQRRTGLSEQEWQHQVGPYVQQQIIASGSYPYLAQALLDDSERPADELFRFGLLRLLESIAAYADARKPEHRR